MENLLMEMNSEESLKVLLKNTKGEFQICVTWDQLNQMKTLTTWFQQKHPRIGKTCNTFY